MKILVIDDHALVREGLCQVLKGLDEDVEVLQAGTCAQGFALSQAHADLDLVLLDYHLPDMTGLVALEIFGTRHPELPILVLSGSANVQVIQHVLRAGASGFVTKSGLSEELLLAIRTVLEGGEYLPDGYDELWAAGPKPVNAPMSTALTQRQDLVLKELLDGRSNREIADRLCVSEETVKSHVAAILRHFDVQNRTQAVVAAARRGYQPLKAAPGSDRL